MSHDAAGPVAIGGVGGSGTRVVAALVRGLGVYLGRDLNESLDNLHFTLLLKRPRWLVRCLAGPGHEVETALAVFGRLMVAGGRALTPAQRAFLAQATEDMRTHGPDLGSTGGGPWAGEREAQALAAPAWDPARDPLWGWKEPNTHLVLPHAEATFPGLRYVHVMRGGLDMAFSANQRQLHNFGAHLGIAPGADGSLGPIESLEFWIRANRAALDFGRRVMGDRFLRLRFEDLCDRPASQIARLADFLGVAVTPDRSAALAGAVRVPDSRARHRDHHLDGFSQQQRAAVRALEA